MKETKASGGLGILGILQIIFIVLKVLRIGEVANWSWAVVLIPLWIDLGIIAIVLIALVIYLIIKLNE